MISRQWTGLAKKEAANDYIAHLKNDTFRKLGTIPGFISASILKRELKDGVEFLIITEWDSIDAIRRFAGDNPETAVVPEPVRQMMIRYDQTVRHYEIEHREG